MGKPNRFLIFVALLVAGALYFALQNPPKLGLDLRGGAQLTLQADLSGTRASAADVLEATRFVVERRINSLGVSEASVVVAGSDRLLVELPGVNDPAQAERVIGRTARLEFRQQKQGTESEFRARLTILRQQELQRAVLQDSTEGKEPTPAVAEQLEKLDRAIAKERKEIFAQFDGVNLSGDRLRDAVATTQGQGDSSWVVRITFDDEGGRIFGELTKNLAGTGRSIGIFLDDELISAPTVGPEFAARGIDDGGAIIRGSFDADSANEFALQLRAGSLPVPVTVIENRTVGASLGADSINSSLVAGLAGLALVLVFMVVYYRILGLVADLALLVYAVLTYACFSVLGVVLTLAGIAGFILSVGMAVDANILIFERTLEELRAGRTLYKSVEAGFYRAWSSILDGNVTTLIACLALFIFGSGLVKGFAVTLGVGVAVSMFTAITFSRAFLLAMVSNPTYRKPAFYGVKAFGKPTDTSSQVEATP